MRKIDEEGLAAILKKLAFLAQTKVYLFWQHSQKQKMRKRWKCDSSLTLPTNRQSCMF
jgi:hypothetical protein